MQQGYSGQEYRAQDVTNASPIRLVVLAYDLAIQSIEKGDFVRASQAVSVLRDALNFDYPEASVGLFRLYQWVLDSLRAGDNTAALGVLMELRDAWVSSEKNLETMMTQPHQPQPPGAYPPVNPPLARA